MKRWIGLILATLMFFTSVPFASAADDYVKFNPNSYSWNVEYTVGKWKFKNVEDLGNRRAYIVIVSFDGSTVPMEGKVRFGAKFYNKLYSYGTPFSVTSFPNWTVFTNHRTNDPVWDFSNLEYVDFTRVEVDIIPPIVTVSPSSSSFVNSISVSVSINEPGTIYYSLDGSEPSLVYSSPLTLTQTTTFKVKAKDTAGNYSQVVTNVYTKDDIPPVVTISPSSGEFENSLSVSISSSKPGTIYYSLDGSEPSVVYAGNITIVNDTVVKAKAKDSSGNISSVVTATYKKKVYEPTLSFSPDSSNFDRPFDMKLTANYPDATIYYSLDGSEPTQVYSSPVRVSAATTVKAKAVYKGVSSPVYEKKYDPSPIQRTDEKFFQVPVSMPDITKYAKDFIKTLSPGMWMFAVAFLGLLIFGIIKKVGRR